MSEHSVRSASQMPTVRIFRDYWSTLTHLIYAIVCLVATPPLFIRAYLHGGIKQALILMVFMAGTFLLYTASSTYHALDLSEKTNRRLRKADHIMIYVLIASTYTPICLLALPSSVGTPLLIVIWVMAFLGVLQAAFFIGCPKWVSAVLYVIMGWACVFVFTQLLSALPIGAFLWLLAGGVIFSGGAILYSLRPKAINFKYTHFGYHEIFHLCCIGGSICHYVLMLVYIAAC